MANKSNKKPSNRGTTITKKARARKRKSPLTVAIVGKSSARLAHFRKMPKRKARPTGMPKAGSEVLVSEHELEAWWAKFQNAQGCAPMGLASQPPTVSKPNGKVKTPQGSVKSTSANANEIAKPPGSRGGKTKETKKSKKKRKLTPGSDCFPNRTVVDYQMPPSRFRGIAEFDARHFGRM